MESQIYEFVSTEIAILVPVLWVIGQMIKSSEKVKNKYIPALLGIVGVFLCGLYQFTLQLPKTGNDMMQVLFFCITQGIICAGLAVYIDQLGKQYLSKE